MIAELQPYPVYKESEQQWLGEIPAHWRLLPNRALFEEVKDRDCPGEEMLSVTIKRGIIRQQALLSDTSKKDSSNVNKAAYKLVQPGDIAYNKMRAWQGAVGASSFRGIVSPAYVVMRPRPGCTPWFYHYLYRTPYFAKEAERWSYGITSDMWSLRPEHFKVIYSVQPPPDEQAAIVRFLDHANGKIERAIRAKRKLIALLNEQKQAIIHRAVTSGLDPNVKLKPSGIPWLGEVPEHWEVMPLRKLVTAGRRITYGIVQPGDPDRSGRFMVRGKDYSFGWASPETIFRVSRQIENTYIRSRLSPGDIVMTIVGAGVGNVAVVPEWLDGANITQTTARVAINSTIAIPHFVELVLKGPVGKRNLERYVYGSAQPRMNLPHVGAFEIPVPPIGEQLAIVRSLDDDLNRMQTAIDRAEREIALLREYRTRLTADVVTGKLDVREAAKHLPPEAEELPPADELLGDESDDEVPEEVEA